MTAPAESVLRPGPKGLGGLLLRWGLAAAPALFALLRRVAPIAKVPFKQIYLVSRHDDVREALAASHALEVPYKTNLDVLMGGQPCFVGMGDTPLYHHDLAQMRAIATPAALPRLAEEAEAEAERIVAAAGGRLEVVDTLTRAVTFAVFRRYIGVPDPPGGDLRVWSTRLFEFQFVDQSQPVRDEVDRIAPALRAHIEREIDRRRAEGRKGDDLLGKALRKQAEDPEHWPDPWIRTALMALIVGGPPQPPMMLPRALDQLLRRPEALAAAQAAARGTTRVEPGAGPPPTLLAYLLEAMRFAPISPILPRKAVTDYVLAPGTPRARTLPADARVLVGIASAMLDPARIPSPKSFDPARQPHQYLLFGHAMHQCFGEHMNYAMFPATMAPLLRRKNLRRARGKAGRLSDAGMFPAALTVEFDPA